MSVGLLINQSYPRRNFSGRGCVRVGQAFGRNAHGGHGAHGHGGGGWLGAVCAGALHALGRAYLSTNFLVLVKYSSAARSNSAGVTFMGRLSYSPTDCMMLQKSDG